MQITNRSRWPETSITGVLERNENDITKIRASIDAATISTRGAQRDAHLKSPDFFQVERHSALTFNSTVISNNADGKLKVSGDLTIRGVTRNVVFDVEGPSPAQKDPWGNTRIGLSATTQISHQLGRPAHQGALIKEGTERVQFDHTFN